tara:strand:- start:44 stop:298 length:255 start_codon:yes stop_codon:yes gene_type:complete
MTNKNILKKQIIYRSSHRGSKEMDMLLGRFVKKYINDFTNDELIMLEQILFIEDEILHHWYFGKKDIDIIPKNKISKMLREFKF